ncbi:MAG TPA: UBP-type zinc finger domain-containing protein [Streptosporangiaceae bacterium]|nr:UBP-type zinc finger domain-containing protein [Streptosporangiaceae bacterium]
MNGWHETYNDFPGPDVVCGHLRRCLVCGQTRCCESSPRRHATAHYEQTGHAVIANQSGGEPWGWCYADGMPLTPDSS